MSNEQSVLERISIARGTSEPAPAPTEEPTAVNVSEDAPIEEEATTEAQAEEVTTDEVEESTQSIEEPEADNESEELYIDLDGEEVSLSDVKKWKSSDMMQADYTQKTQKVAEERKAVEAEKAQVSELQQQLNEQLAKVEAIMARDTLSAEELTELREYDPEKFIEYNEKQSELEKLVKSKQSTPAFDVQAEQAKLWEANPQWLSDGKQTEAFNKDMALLQDYAGKQGYVDSDIAGFRARDFDSLIKAAKYDALQSKNAAVTKKVRKAPVATKPRSSTKSATQSALQKAQAAFKANPSVDNAVKLRKLKQQINS